MFSQGGSFRLQFGLEFPEFFEIYVKNYEDMHKPAKQFNGVYENNNPHQGRVEITIQALTFREEAHGYQTDMYGLR